jgi:hypothetical protein
MRSPTSLALLLPAFLVLGCGSSEPTPVPVRGTVLLDNEPLKEGQITFITPGQVPEAVDVRDGKFDGRAKWGERRVEIAAYRPYKIPADVPKSMHALMEGGKENYLPEKYHRKSELKATIPQDGVSDLKFELSSK